jgi:hypothetical protein
MNTGKIKLAAMITAGLVGSVLAASASACDVSDLGAGADPAHAEAFAKFTAGIATDQQRRRTDSPQGQKNLSAAAPQAIVGLWKFAWTAPDGVSSIDWGFQAWHSDGTEITNSGGRPPSSGNFCMGVWTQHGPGHYRLNHWAIAWGLPPDFDTSAVSGLVNIREDLTLDKFGDSMTGSVSLDLYDLDGTTLLANLVEGTVVGARVTP